MLKKLKRLSRWFRWLPRRIAWHWRKWTFRMPPGMDADEALRYETLLDLYDSCGMMWLADQIREALSRDGFRAPTVLREGRLWDAHEALIRECATDALREPDRRTGYELYTFWTLLHTLLLSYGIDGGLLHVKPGVCPPITLGPGLRDHILDEVRTRMQGRR